MKGKLRANASNLAALFLLSMGITAYQPALMQVLSFIQWHHFGYMMISIALLGFGASGTVLSIYRPFFENVYDRILPLLMISCGLLMPCCLALSQSPAFGFDLYLMFVEKGQMVRFSLVCLIFFLPFFCAALAMGMMLTRDSDTVGFLYAGNLVGAGGGCLLALLLLELLPQEGLSAILGLLPILAGAMLQGGRHRLPMIFAGGAAVVCLLMFFNPPTLRLSEYKALARTLHLPDTTLLTKASSARGTVHVLRSDALRVAPGLSLNYDGAVPKQDLVFVNGEVTCSLPRPDFHSISGWFDHIPEGGVNTLRRPNRALILHMEPSVFLHLLEKGAGEVDVVEPHPRVCEIVESRLRETHYPSETLRFIPTEPRTWLDTTTERYDLIRFPVLGSFHGGVGLYALNEQFLLTSRSFSRAWEHLKPGGLISITCWMDYPLRVPLKLLATLVETLERAGVEHVRDHLLAIRGWNSITFAISRSPVSDQETARLRAVCSDNSFDPLLLPDLDPAERARYNQLMDNRFFDIVDDLVDGDRDHQYNDYDFNIRPATDAQPYFSQFLKIDRIASLNDQLGLRNLPFIELGSMILVLTLGLLLVPALLLILIPFYRLRIAKTEALRTFAYFGSLGCGYMMVEIVWMQRLTLLLGHPLITIATVLSSLLIFSGLGSLVSERMRAVQKTIRILGVVIAMATLLYGVVFTYLWHNALAYPLVLKIILASLMIAPLAFLMGFPFPLGLRRLWPLRKNQLAWAWGINGCFSVISPPCAMLLAIHFGFPSVFLVAALAYGLAAFTTP